MRNISQAALTQLGQRLGNESITIIEIDWVPGSTLVYADRTVEKIHGKIITLSDLDDVAQLTGNSGNQQVTVTLDDVDGTLKSILDTTDVHKRPARVYQYFTGLDLSDRFLLFDGYLSTPIVWNERERTVTVTILSQLELDEIIATVEDSWPGPVPAPLMGKRFPMIFGAMDNVPAVQMRTPTAGAILQPVGVLAGEELLLKYPLQDTTDFDISVQQRGYELQFLQNLIGIYNDAATRAQADGYPRASQQYINARDSYIAQREKLQQAIVNSLSQQEQAISCAIARRQFAIEQAKLLGYGTNPVEILGGEFYPQGPVTVQIGDATFTGSMQGNQLTIDDRSSDYLTKLAEGAYNSKMAAWDKNSPSYDPCLMNQTIVQYWQWPGGAFPATPLQIPAANAQGKWDGSCTQPYVWPAPFMKFSYTLNLASFNNEPILQHSWFPAGTSVRLLDGQSLKYLVSATPGTVTAVRAIKNVSGVQLLVDVPSYTASVQTFGTAQVTVVELPQPLSSIPDEGWTDQVYVSFASDVGPNVADIIEWLIDNYTHNSCDEASFTQARALGILANFVITDFQDVLSLIRNVAFQANCDVRLVEGDVQLQSLVGRPTTVDTIRECDVDAEHGIEVSLTPTEDLVTKMTINWSTLPIINNEHVSQKVWGGTSYVDQIIWGLDPDALERPHYSLTLRNNVEKYGPFAATYNYYLFTDPSLITRCAKFRLVRQSNSWKRVSFTTPLHKLNIEVGDAVLLDFQSPYVSSTAVPALVQVAKYDSANNCIHFQCLTPVRAGSLTEDLTFWTG